MPSKKPPPTRTIIEHVSRPVPEPDAAEVEWLPLFSCMVERWVGPANEQGAWRFKWGPSCAPLHTCLTWAAAQCDRAVLAVADQRYSVGRYRFSTFPRIDEAELEQLRAASAAAYEAAVRWQANVTLEGSGPVRMAETPFQDLTVGECRVTADGLALSLSFTAPDDEVNTARTLGLASAALTGDWMDSAPLARVDLLRRA